MHSDTDPDRDRPAGVDGLLEELEGQAQALEQQERAYEVRDRAVEAYRDVDLLSRLLAARGAVVEVDLGAAGRLRGTVEEAGVGWLVLGPPPGPGRSAPSGQVLVALAAVQAVSGLPATAAAAAVRPAAARRSLGTRVWRLLDGAPAATVRLRDGTLRRGAPRRVGADFLELVEDSGCTGSSEGPRGGATVVRLDAVATLAR